MYLIRVQGGYDSGGRLYRYISSLGFVSGWWASCLFLSNASSHRPRARSISGCNKLGPPANRLCHLLQAGRHSAANRDHEALDERSPNLLASVMRSPLGKTQIIPPMCTHHSKQKQKIYMQCTTYTSRVCAFVALMQHS